jgi:cobalt-zinc-cadmium efflux system protein
LASKGVFDLSSAPHSHDHSKPGHSHAAPGTTGEAVAAHRAADRRRMVGALALTVGIAVVEAVGGWLTHSLALLSDAGHMLTDVSALALALLALWFAGRPADPRRTYGYVRLEILSALVNGVLLLGITLLIVVEAFSRLRDAPQVNLLPMACAPTWARWLFCTEATPSTRGLHFSMLSETPCPASVCSWEPG